MANWIERGKRRVFEKKTGGNESVNRRNHFEIFQISREKSSRHVDEGKMDRDNFKDNYFRNSNFACNVRFFFFFLKNLDRCENEREVYDTWKKAFR